MREDLSEFVLVRLADSLCNASALGLSIDFGYPLSRLSARMVRKCGARFPFHLIRSFGGRICLSAVACSGWASPLLDLEFSARLAFFKVSVGVPLSSVKTVNTTQQNEIVRSLACLGRLRVVRSRVSFAVVVVPVCGGGTTAKHLRAASSHSVRTYEG